MQTGYYNAEWERFINADGLLDEGVLGNDLFEYCGNNPVNRADSNGCYYNKCISISSGPGEAFTEIRVALSVIQITQIMGEYAKSTAISTTVDISANALELGGNFGCELGKYALSDSSDCPSNNGIGTYEKIIKSKIKKISAIESKISNASKALGYLNVVVQTSEGIDANSKNGASYEKIAWDASVDTAIYGVNTWVSIETGATVGSLLGPFGTAGGAVFGWLTSYGLNSISSETRKK